MDNGALGRRRGQWGHRDVRMDDEATGRGGWSHRNAGIDDGAARMEEG